LPAPTQPIASYMPSQQEVPLPPNLNLVLQQLGLPQLRVQNPNVVNPNPGPRLEIRPLLAPLAMLLIRTLLLLYFVAPARTPVIGILIFAWAMYEIWRPIRAAMLRLAAANNAAVDIGAPIQPAPQQNGEGPAGPLPNGQPQAGPPVGQQQQQLDAAARPNTIAGPQGDYLLDTISNINLQAEESSINPAQGVNPPRPSLVHKTFTFLTLFVVTFLPEAWNRRRATLRRREGRLRTEAHAREAAAAAASEDTEDPNRVIDERQERIRAELVAQHARRPLWVRSYLARVRSGDWVDEAD